MSSGRLVVRRALRFGSEVDLVVTARGRVEELLSHAPERDFGQARIVEAEGLILLPGLTDVHTHLREPGFEYKEDVASGLEAAAHGGFSNILCMANTSPVNDNAGVTEFIRDQARASWPKGPRLYPVGALTKNLEGSELSAMAELAEAGCRAFSNDGIPVADTEIFRRAMEYASDLGLMVIDHCEDPHLAPGVGANEGRSSSRLGLAAQPDVAEALQAARDILLADYLGLPLHLAHVSCARTVELIAWAKERGVRVTAETCPHYLLLTDESLSDYDSRYKVNPPLRTEQDVASMIQALKDGVVDMLATDHAPHAEHEKEVEFEAAPCGISGLDTALSATWALVESGALTQEDFERAWVQAPCSAFDLPFNTFAKGDPADFLLFDPGAEWTVTAETLRSKGKNTPLMGKTLKGQVISHFLEGKKII